ncbi:MAG: response regulator, partial [Puniceicoccales bacterium]
ARSIEEAEALRAALTFRIAIVDIRLPDGNGLQLVQEWKDTGTFSHIIATSASGDSESRELSLQSGADAFLSKPFEMEDIRECLPADLSHRTPRPLPRKARGLSALRTIENHTLRTHGELSLIRKDFPSFLKAVHHFTNEAFAHQINGASLAFANSEEAARHHDWGEASKLWEKGWTQLTGGN